MSTSAKKTDPQNFQEWIRLAFQGLKNNYSGRSNSGEIRSLESSLQQSETALLNDIKTRHIAGIQKFVLAKIGIESYIQRAIKEKKINNDAKAISTAKSNAKKSASQLPLIDFSQDEYNTYLADLASTTSYMLRQHTFHRALVGMLLTANDAKAIHHPQKLLESLKTIVDRRNFIFDYFPPSLIKTKGASGPSAKEQKDEPNPPALPTRKNSPSGSRSS